ncbi:MAG: hypothetical protein M3Q80_01670, partial [bacterium]|nr:hypothetical protein [bacterium]
GQKDYRTYIYSSIGYIKLLRQSGFPLTKFYYPYTTYREPHYIYSEEKGVRTFILKSYLQKIYTKKWTIFLRLASIVSLDRFFLSSFMIMSSSSATSLLKPYITSLAQAQSSEIHDTDTYMKIPSDEESPAMFLVFHTGTSKPYAEISVARNGAPHVTIKKL